MKIGTYKFGIIAEYCAIILLLVKMYKILKIRYRNYSGEIDIIAKKGNMLVFVEVKARMRLDQNYTPVSDHQIRRIRNAATLFIAQNPKYHNCDVRFDLIIIAGNALPKHMRNAW